jgi:hypothetical protein
MHKTLWLLLLGLGAPALLPTLGGRASGQEPAQDGAADWRKILAERPPAYGHRNGIAVADSAYPAQARDAIETITTGASQAEVVESDVDAVGRSKHVRPVVYLDAQLPLVPEDDSRGIGKYRADLDRILAGRTVKSFPHEEIIGKLDEAGRTFRVLVMKTDLAIPYTSVFTELDCGYCSPEAERRIREAMRFRAT